MMRKLFAVTMLAIVLPWMTIAQTIGIVDSATPIVGGTTGQCVTKGSNGTVLLSACGGSPSGSAGGVLNGSYPNPGFASDPVFSNTVSTSGATTTSPNFEVSVTGDTNTRVALGVNSTDVPSISFGPGNAVRDLFLERAAAAKLRLGAPDAASPVAQTIRVQNVVTGTTNTAGAALTIAGSQGTGTGAGGSILFQTAPAGSTGTTQNALATALTINSSGQSVFGNGTVSLPSFTLAGDTTTGFYYRTTNALSLTINGTLRTEFLTTGIRAGSGHVYGWSSSSTPNAANDTGLSRVSTGVVAVGNGTAGNATGTIRAGALSAGGSDFSITAVNTVSPTSPNRTLTIVYNGVTYYLAAKTTND